MDYARPEALVETQWLADNLALPGIALIDASFHLPTANRDPKAEFSMAHIPGAVFFDINAIAEKETVLPHMLPDADQFAADMSALGISNDDHVICYDANGGAMAAMRAFWMFTIFGHSNVSLLHGGLPQWRAEGRATDSGNVTPQPTDYTASDFKIDRVKNADDVRQNIERATAQVVDARSPGVSTPENRNLGTACAGVMFRVPSTFRSRTCFTWTDICASGRRMRYWQSYKAPASIPKLQLFQAVDQV